MPNVRWAVCWPAVADEIFDAASDLLARVEAAAAAAAVTLPDRRFVSNGEVAFDCALVAVQLPSAFRGTPAFPESDRNRRNTVVWTFEFTVWLVRDVPILSEQGVWPSAAAITDSASIILRDAHVLTYGLLPQLDELAAGCTSLAVGNLAGVGPEGGVAGWQLPVQIGL